MVVTKKEFQDVITQMNTILTKLDGRLKQLETQTPAKQSTRKTTKDSEEG